MLLLLQNSSLHYSPQVLAIKEISVKLKSVFSEVVKILNFFNVKFPNFPLIFIYLWRHGIVTSAASQIYRGVLAFLRKNVVLTVWNLSWVVAFCWRENLTGKIIWR
jgi:hypothetical protein